MKTKRRRLNTDISIPGPSRPHGSHPDSGTPPLIMTNGVRTPRKRKPPFKLRDHVSANIRLTTTKRRQATEEVPVVPAKRPLKTRPGEDEATGSVVVPPTQSDPVVPSTNIPQGKGIEVGADGPSGSAFVHDANRLELGDEHPNTSGTNEEGIANNVGIVGVGYILDPRVEEFHRFKRTYLAKYLTGLIVDKYLRENLVKEPATSRSRR